MKISKLIIVLAMALGAGVMAVAQETSPYSKYGYGILGDNATSAQRQMGGVGYAMNSGRQINVMNPASYAAIDSLTFLMDMGVDFSILSRKDNAGSSHDYGGGLDYLTIQFPVTRYLGVSAGLLPYSSVGYTFGNKIENGSMSHQGSGGINQLYLGVGATPFKNFRIGANVSYLFGSTYNDVYATASSSSSALFEQVLEVKDYHLQFGAQYSIDINRKNRVSVGVVFSPAKTLLGHTYVQQYIVNSTAAPDTVAYENLRNNFSLPDTWGAGIAYEWNRRLLVELDFTYQNWAKAKYKQIENFSATELTDRWKVALGASYTPNPRGGYFKRMTYRAGGFFNHDYIKVNGNDVREYGVACGFGFPAASNKTIINLGFEYRHRQAHPDPLLKENYFNFTLGVNFNQSWFFKSKIR
ncbi:MAG: hypothetical protein OSJ46_06505 [Duncaniella sp.]|nr:hypothetical protein [Duncaniella sp.]